MNRLFSAIGRILSGNSSEPAGAPDGREGAFIAFENANKRRYKLYVPSGYRQGRPIPLVVMLHGCQQNPDDFAAGTEMNDYAEQHTLLVMYPEQPRTANQGSCWNWFKKENQVRGSGEPAEIVELVEQVKRYYAVDSQRVYVAGISAGSAMATILGATYPDVFAALGLCSGPAYRQATNGLTAFLAQAGWRGDPRKSGQAAYDAMGPHCRVMPVIIFQGTADKQLAPSNADKVLEQWLYTNQLVAENKQLPMLDAAPDRVIEGKPAKDGAHPFMLTVYSDQHGQVLMERYMVEGMGHAWSGGSNAGSFTDPHGPKASQMLINFFLAHPMVGTHGVRATMQPQKQPVRMRTVGE